MLPARRPDRARRRRNDHGIAVARLTDVGRGKVGSDAVDDQYPKASNGGKSASVTRPTIAAVSTAAKSCKSNHPETISPGRTSALLLAIISPTISARIGLPMATGTE